MITFVAETITLDQAREMRRELEGSIWRLAAIFEGDTCLRVKSIRVERITTFDDEQAAMIGVRVDVDLGRWQGGGSR